jgi:hypothetical protein
MADGTKTERMEPAAVASYVAAMSAELSMLAHRHGFETLGFLLEMARLEAESTATQLNGATGDARSG